ALASSIYTCMIFLFSSLCCSDHHPDSHAFPTRRSSDLTAVATPPSVIVRDQFANPVAGVAATFATSGDNGTVDPATPVATGANGDRKSTRLNSSHQIISYAVFCLKKKKKWKASTATQTH